MEVKEKTDMTFEEMFTGLYNIEFLHPPELESIYKTAEAYAEAKVDNKLKEIKENKPRIEDFSGGATMKEVHKAYIGNPIMWKYMTAVDNYIDEVTK